MFDKLKKKLGLKEGSDPSASTLAVASTNSVGPTNSDATLPPPYSEAEPPTYAAGAPPPTEPSRACPGHASYVLEDFSMLSASPYPATTTTPAAAAESEKTTSPASTPVFAYAPVLPRLIREPSKEPEPAAEDRPMAGPPHPGAVDPDILDGRLVRARLAQYKLGARGWNVQGIEQREDPHRCRYCVPSADGKTHLHSMEDPLLKWGKGGPRGWW